MLIALGEGTHLPGAKVPYYDSKLPLYHSITLSYPLQYLDAVIFQVRKNNNMRNCRETVVVILCALAPTLLLVMGC